MAHQHGAADDLVAIFLIDTAAKLGTDVHVGHGLD